MATVGTVQTIARYPVKSMRGEELPGVDVDFCGLPLDRGFAFVEDELYTPFPWFTGRQHQGLFRYQPVWDTSGERPRLDVITASGTRLPVTSPELLDELEKASGKRLRLHSDYRGSQDVAYISLISISTINALAAEAGVKPDHRRFRMNLTIEGDAPPFSEQEWVGRTLRIGDLVIAVTEPDRRCQMITFDPETGAGTPAVLKSAGQLNGACVGVYGSILREGRVNVGDVIDLLPA